jgi:hypothetical protein
LPALQNDLGHRDRSNSSKDRHDKRRHQEIKRWIAIRGKQKPGSLSAPGIDLYLVIDVALLTDRKIRLGEVIGIPFRMTKPPFRNLFEPIGGV